MFKHVVMNFRNYHYPERALKEVKNKVAKHILLVSQSDSRKIPRQCKREHCSPIILYSAYFRLVEDGLIDT